MWLFSAWVSGQLECQMHFTLQTDKNNWHIVFLLPFKGYLLEYHTHQISPSAWTLKLQLCGLRLRIFSNILANIYFRYANQESRKDNFRKHLSRNWHERVVGKNWWLVSYPLQFTDILCNHEWGQDCEIFRCIGNMSVHPLYQPSTLQKTFSVFLRGWKRSHKVIVIF